MSTTPRLADSSGYAFISHSQQTFPENTPEIDNAQLARRKRRRTSPMEQTILEREFADCFKPNKKQREAIARRVGMSNKAVQIWFQNRRQAARKRGDEVITMTTTTTTGLTTPMTASRSTSTTGISVYRDRSMTTTPVVQKNQKLCLSMSDDGKAQVITANKTPERVSKRRTITSPLASRGNSTGSRSGQLTPLSPVKSSSLNALLRFKNNSSPKSPTAREKECISNLLSLREADWN